MKHGMTEELHGFNSPYFERFIQKGIWKDLAGEEIKDENDQEAQRKRFATTIQTTCKHYMKINQPINLFNYVYDALIVHCDNPKNSIDVEERINWLQKVLAYIPNNFPQDQISHDFILNKNKTALIVKIL